MAICPSFIGAHVMRITRLDNCGRPLYGEDSQAVTDGFVSVEFAPEVEEGEDYTLRNAAGKLCISERGPDALQWINVTIEFCNVDPCLWTIMNPAWPVVKNAQGEITGLRIGEDFDDTKGFALELWPKVTSQGSVCDDDAAEDADPNGYFLLPYVIGGAPDSWTFEDAALTFSLSGRTKGGSLWGRGPYNITHDANGNPTPLLEPINSGSNGGNPDHLHMDIVTVSPPEPTCGCQPLEPIRPGVENNEITTDPEQPNRACAIITGSAARQVRIDWGDGSDEVTSRVGREECHLYEEEGTYTVEVCDIDAESGDEDLCRTYEVTIDEVPPLPDPDISVSPTSGEAPLSVVLTVDNHTNGQVVIDWGDGTDPETVDGNTGSDDDEEATYPHQYVEGNEEPYTITVTAEADDRAESTTEVEVFPDTSDEGPEVSIAPDQGPAPLQVTLTVNNYGRGDVVIDWGDGSSEETVDGGDTGQETEHDHTFDDAGEYTVTVYDEQDTELSTTVTVEVLGS